jgi:hypothetical protein
VCAALLYDFKSISYVKLLFPSTSPDEEQPHWNILRATDEKSFIDTLPEMVLDGDIWRGTPLENVTKVAQVCFFIIC